MQGKRVVLYCIMLLVQLSYFAPTELVWWGQWFFYTHFTPTGLDIGFKMAKFTEPPLFKKTYDMIRWVNEETTKFPKSQRFTLAQRIQDESLELLKCFISARRGLEVEKNFKQADVQLETIRLLFRLAKDLALLSLKKYEIINKMVDELGKLLGDWQKRKKQ
jgi:hypothetical protein